MHRGSITAAVVAALTFLLIGVAAAALAPSASADFPYTRPAGDPTDPTDLYLGPGQVGNDLGGNEFKYAATPDPANVLTNANPVELGGVRGAHVVDDDPAAATAFQRTTGRPDVTIAILDSGIKWNDAGAMEDLRFKNRLNEGELEPPRNDGLGTPHVAGEDCSGSGPYSHAGDWDLNGDAVFNLLDYSCDNRVQTDTPKGVGPAGMFEPQDVLIAFSDGVDDDHNGYVDDIVGWDFLDDDNDPFDDVQYGHGTGEARDSTSEADNGGDLGSCPNCMGVYLRVGDSFIADVNRFGQAVIYATDNDVQVVQEALGTLNNASLARQAVDYAYRHGVTVMASAADEAAQHNNWPSTLPHVIVTNSVTNNDPVPAPHAELSRLQRLHQLQRQDHDRDSVDQLLVECRRSGRRLRGPRLQRRPERARQGRAQPLSGHGRVPGGGWRSLPDHAERGPAAARLRNRRRRHPGRRRELRRPPGRLGQRAVLLAGGAAGLHQPLRPRRPAQGAGGPQPPGTARPAGRLEQLPGARRPRPVLRLRPGQRLQRGQAADRPEPCLPDDSAAAARGRDLLAGVVRADRPGPLQRRRGRRGLRARIVLHLRAARGPGPIPEQQSDHRLGAWRLRRPR